MRMCIPFLVSDISIPYHLCYFPCIFLFGCVVFAGHMSHLFIFNLLFFVHLHVITEAAGHWSLKTPQNPTKIPENTWQKTIWHGNGIIVCGNSLWKGNSHQEDARLDQSCNFTTAHWKTASFRLTYGTSLCPLQEMTCPRQSSFHVAHIYWNWTKSELMYTCGYLNDVTGALAGRRTPRGDVRVVAAPLPLQIRTDIVGIHVGTGVSWRRQGKGKSMVTQKDRASLNIQIELDLQNVLNAETISPVQLNFSDNSYKGRTISKICAKLWYWIQ